MVAQHSAYWSHPCFLHTGLAAFELPLVYIKDDKFNQPIFGCNNLAGLVHASSLQ